MWRRRYSACPKWPSATPSSVFFGNIVGDARSTSSYAGGTGRSNLSNARSGLGSRTDKTSDTSFVERLLGPYELERIYRQSWAAGKMIDIPVNDMWVPGRRWIGKDTDIAKTMTEADEKIKVRTKMAMVMKSARLFGSALLLVIPKTGDMATPLRPEDYQPDSISHLLVVNRWNVSILRWQGGIRNENYGQPETYLVNPNVSINVPRFEIHHTRCFVFHGIAPLNTEGWYAGGYGFGDASNGALNLHRNWGISELTRAIDSFLHQASTSQGAAHLAQQASVLAMKVMGHKQAVLGRPDPATPTAEQLIEDANIMLSNFRMIAIDSEDDIARIAVNFSGLPQLIDRMYLLIAAIADIPATRFLAQSPAGMDATGDSDTINYAIRAESLRLDMLGSHLGRLDMMIARNAGLAMPPPYEWFPILNLSPADRINAAAIRSRAIMEMVDRRIIDEDEARQLLQPDPTWDRALFDAPWTPPKALDLEAPPANGSNTMFNQRNQASRSRTTNNGQN